MPEQTQQSASTASAPATSYVQSLISPDLGSEEQVAAEPQKPEVAPETEAVAPKEEPQPEKTEQVEGDNLPAVEDLIQKFAEEMGLNPQDPNQRKILKRVADKERFILKLQADQAAYQKTALQPKPEEPAELITEYEKSRMQAEPEQPAKPEPQPAAAQPQPARYGDVGDVWKTPEDSLTALNEAWAANDLRKVHEIEVARQLRNFDAFIMPRVLQLMENRLKQYAEKDLGDIVPAVRQSVAERKQSEARDFAIDQLRKAGASDIDNLFVHEEGPPIQYEGMSFPNNALNRILVKYPAIMRIVETDDNGTEDLNQTYISRYKMAYDIFRSSRGGIQAQTAKKLVEAGAQMKERESADRARQAINAGPGATGLGERAKPKSYVTELNNSSGDIPFGSLFS